MIKLSFYRGAQFACRSLILGLELAEPRQELRC
jgi:hypothetical protein